MSRSQRAWTERRALVRAVVRRAGRLDRRQRGAHLGHECLLGTARSFPRLVGLAVTVIVLALAVVPAVSLGKLASAHTRSSTSATQSRPGHSSSPPRAASGAAGRGSDPRAPGGSDRPDVAQARVGRAGARSLAPESGYFTSDGSGPVRALQRALAAVGDPPGPFDGRWGPLTEAAVIRFQTANGLPVDGIAGPRTRAALAAAEPVLYPGVGYQQPEGSPAVRRLQRALTAAGDSPVLIDGRYGPETERAVIRFQTANGLRVDGTAGPRTLARLARQSNRRRPDRRARPVRSRSRATTHLTRAPAAHHATRAGGMSWLVVVLVCGFVLGWLASGLMLARRRQRRHMLRALIAASAPLPSPHPPASTASEGPSNGREPAMAGESRGEAADRHAGQRVDCREALALGERLEQRGERLAAELAYQYADQLGDANAAGKLGALMHARGDLLGAAAAYQRADQRGLAAAARNLGRLLEGRGDLAGAEQAFRRADQRGDPIATYNLARLLHQRGALSETREVLQRAGHGGSTRIAHLARAALATLETSGNRHDAQQTEQGSR